LPDDLAVYFDLVEKGFENILDKLSCLEMLEIWVDRQNRQMFEYEVQVGKNKEYKKDYPYLTKSK